MAKLAGLLVGIKDTNQQGTKPMGVARILDRVVQTMSRDEGDVTRVTACHYVLCKQGMKIHNPEVQFHYCKDPQDILA